MQAHNDLLAVLTLPVWLGVGWTFHRGTLLSLRHGVVNMDTLISLGSSVAFIFSLVATVVLPGQATYYDTAALIVTLIYAGKYLEAAAKSRATAAITALAGLQPRTAHVIRNGTERDVPVEQVVVGDTLVVRPGEKLAVDGVVLAIEATLSELVRKHGLRRHRSRGEAKRHFEHLLTGAACNLKRLVRALVARGEREAAASALAVVGRRPRMAAPPRAA